MGDTNITEASFLDFRILNNKNLTRSANPQSDRKTVIIAKIMYIIKSTSVYIILKCVNCATNIEEFLRR